jgi:hypothetical protein
MIKTNNILDIRFIFPFLQERSLNDQIQDCLSLDELE